MTMANENTTSLDLPPALARILGMQTEIPSFQDGGMIPQQSKTQEFGNVVGNYFKTRASTPLGVAGLIPNPISGAMSAGQNLNQAALMLRAGPAGPRALSKPYVSDFGKYFPEVDKGAQDWGRIDIYRDTNQPQPQQPSVDMNTVDNSYAEGGMVGMEGMRVPPGAVPGMPMAGVNPEMSDDTPMDSQAMQMQVNQVASRHPQAMAEIRNAIMEELQSGDLTPQELNMIVQLTQVAAGNPEMYPYVKQFAMQQGLAAAGDLPDQYDQGLVMVLLLAARAVQQDLGGAPAEAGQMPANAGPAIPSMRKGGMLPASGKSEPVIIEAHTGEYVIPKHVVDMKGKEFFDSLVEKYKDRK